MGNQREDLHSDSAPGRNFTPFRLSPLISLESYLEATEGTVGSSLARFVWTINWEHMSVAVLLLWVGDLGTGFSRDIYSMSCVACRGLDDLAFFCQSGLQHLAACRK